MMGGTRVRHVLTFDGQMTIERDITSLTIDLIGALLFVVGLKVSYIMLLAM